MRYCGIERPPLFEEAVDPTRSSEPFHNSGKRRNSSSASSAGLRQRSRMSPDRSVTPRVLQEHPRVLSGAAEPARPADLAERFLFSGVLERGVVTLGRRRVAAEEVDLDFADEPATELGVTNA